MKVKGTASVVQMLRKVTLRGFLLYFAGILTVVLLTDAGGMFQLVKLRVLNRLMPAMTYFDDDAQPEWQEHVYYYRKVTRYLPKLSNGYHLLGYSLYQIGEEDEALEAYQRSITINPYFIFSHYNLGMIYFQRQNYEKALQSFEKALLTKMNVNVRIMFLSKIYQQIIAANEVGKEKIIKGLQDSLNLAALMRVRCLLELERNKEAFVYAGKIMELGWPTEGQAPYFAGLAAMNMDNVPMAIYFLRQSIEENSDFAEAYHYLGYLLKSSSETNLPQTLLLRAKYLDDQGVSPLKKPLELKIL